MALLLLLSLTLAFLIYYSNTNSIAKSLLYALIVASILILFSTELLSILGIFNHNSLVAFWVSINAFLILFIVYKKIKVGLIAVMLHDLKAILQNNFTLWGICVLLGLNFIIATQYVPNNWDSMTYHLSRVAHWVSNETVAHYPANDFRQTHMPPLEEFCIAQINILNYNDSYSFCVEWLALIGSCIALYLLAIEIGMERKSARIVSFIACTIPEAILQSTSTQSGVLVGFFILCTIFFLIKHYRYGHLKDVISIGVCLGLATLSKSTTFLFLFPVLIVWGGLLIKRYFLKQINIYQIGTACGLVLACFLILNIGYFSRNFQLNQNILASDKVLTRIYSNEKIGVKPIVSNIIKNLSLHYGLFGINKIVEQGVLSCHQMIHYPSNALENTWGGMEFELKPFGIHEDTGANIFHLSVLLIGTSIFLLRKQAMKSSIKYILWLIGVQFLIFCIYLKWQPWHTRLHTPLFLLGSIPIAYFIGVLIPKKWIQQVILSGLFIYTLTLIIINPSKPLINLRKYSGIKKHSFDTPSDRFSKYFMNQMTIKEDYVAVKCLLDATHLKRIGLFLGSNTYEYPLFYDIYSNPTRKPICLNVTNNITKKIFSPLAVDCIVADITVEQITYLGKIYHKSTKGRYLNLYQ